MRPIALVVLTLVVALDRRSAGRLDGPSRLPVPLAVPQDAETAVRDSLQRYAAALESLDASAVKKIQPSIAADTLAKAFRDMRELKVVIDAVRVISLDDAAARVSCKVRDAHAQSRIHPNNRGHPRGAHAREAAGWVIDAFER